MKQSHAVTGRFVNFGRVLSHPSITVGRVTNYEESVDRLAYKKTLGFEIRSHLTLGCLATEEVTGQCPNHEMTLIQLIQHMHPTLRLKHLGVFDEPPARLSKFYALVGL